MAKQSIAEMSKVDEPRRPFDLLENAKKTLEVLLEQRKELQDKVDRFLAYKRLKQVSLDCEDIAAAIQQEEDRRGG